MTLKFAPKDTRRVKPAVPEKAGRALRTDVKKDMVVQLLDMFYERSDTARNLLGNNYKQKLDVVAKGKGTGGHAKGEEVTVDVKKEKSDQFMTNEEAAETAIFEFQNAKNASVYKQHKNDLGRKLTLRQYGMKMAYTEYESTIAVANVLRDIETSNVGYEPSLWGKKQIQNSDKDKEHFACSPHNPKAPPGDKFGLKSWELYAYQIIEGEEWIPNYADRVFKWMAESTFDRPGSLRSECYSPYEFINSLPASAGKNLSYYIHCVEFLKLLESSRNNHWHVKWKVSATEWEFTPEMKLAAGVSNPEHGLKDLFDEFASDYGLNVHF